MKLLIKYATRSRPFQFIQAIRNITETIGYDNYMILVTYDVDDSTMTSDVIDLALSINSKIIFDVNDSPERNKIQAINHGMDLCYDWDWLVNMSDDMVFITTGWAEKILNDVGRIFPEMTDWFAHYDDGYQHDKLPTMSIMDRNYYERDRYIYHPSYKSFSCDAEAMYVAMMRERYYYSDAKYFQHQHPANSPKLRTDSLYAHNGQYGHEDTENYFKRLRDYFDLKGEKEQQLMPTDTYNHWKGRIPE